MHEQVIDQKLQEALKLHDEGKSYAAIRAYFEAELNEETISYLIRLVDEFAIEENRIKEEIKKVRFKMQVGVVAFILSCFLLYLLHTYDALSDLTSQTIYVIMVFIQYFPVLLSLYFLWNAYKEELRLKKMEPEIDDTKFQMKRRRKAR